MSLGKHTLKVIAPERFDIEIAESHWVNGGAGVTWSGVKAKFTSFDPTCEKLTDLMRSDDPKFDFMWRPKGVNVFGGAMVTDCTCEQMDVYDDRVLWKFSVMYSSVQSLTPVEIAKMKCSGEWDDYIG